MTEITKDIADLREVAGTGETSDWMTWPKVDPAKLRRVLDLIEAERQRADKLDKWVKCVEAERDKNIAWHSKQLKRADKAEEELAALRGEQVLVADVVRDANRYRFLRDEDAWSEDSDSWDVETRTGLISSENLLELRTDHFDAAIDARMAASDIPFFNPVSELFTRQPKPVAQTLTDLPYDVLFNAIAKSATPLGEHMSISVKDFKAAIQAGIVVKDGE